MKKTMYALLVGMFLNIPVQAQFLKKLGDKITNKVEKTISENISDKAAKETNETLNQTWKSMDNPGTNAKIPKSYNFDWKYSVSMNTEKMNMDVTYRLKENANYMGMGGGRMGNIFLVMDFENDMTVMYMNGMVRSTKIPKENAGKNPYSDIAYEKIGSKTILGYECEGYRAETEDYVFTFYITDDVGVGFGSLYKNQKYLPEGFDSDWLNEDSLMMSMQMTDKKDPDKNMSMTCTGIEKDDFTISK